MKTSGISGALTKQLKQIYWSDRFKRIVALPDRLVIFAKQRRNRPIFCVEIRATCGLFATLQLILFILTYCKDKNRYPDISARSGLYGDRAGCVDWFALCFERIRSYGPELEERIRRKTDISIVRILNVQQLGFRRRYEETLQLTEATQLFSEYYRPSSDILRKVDNIARELSVGCFTLGVHYRGTDKVNESGRVPWEILVDAIAKTLAHEPRITNLLVSSDEPQFLNFLREHRFTCPVNFIPSVHLSANGKPAHFSGHEGLEILQEALVASLLLSRCGFLIKTASYLSAWSKIFNPGLKVLLISPPGAWKLWFPDSALWISQRSNTKEFSSIPAFAWYRQDSSRE